MAALVGNGINLCVLICEIGFSGNAWMLLLRFGPSQMFMAIQVFLVQNLQMIDLSSASHAFLKLFASGIGALALILLGYAVWIADNLGELIAGPFVFGLIFSPVVLVHAGFCFCLCWVFQPNGSVSAFVSGAILAGVALFAVIELEWVLPLH